MTVVFFSTAAARFDPSAVELYVYPRRADLWRSLSERYPVHQFCIVTQKPAHFLLDDAGQGFENLSALAADERGFPNADALPLTAGKPVLAHDFPRNVRVFLLPEEAPAAAVAEKILELSPDVAVSATFWTAPFDWLGIQDAMVADRLREKGIPVLCHSRNLSLDFFDKNRTHALLERHGFTMPRSVYVHHELYWCERQHHELTRNVYKECVLEQIRALNYPVVIKDTVGLSSYSMEVAVSFKQALTYLNSGRTKVDRIVEEYIQGTQGGVELFSGPAVLNKGASLTILPPLLFSLNRYGITSPKQSVKLGGIRGQPAEESFHMQELTGMLEKLSALPGFSGPFQIDLVHADTPTQDGRWWHIIEVNPRLSGMSETSAASLHLSLPEVLLRTALGEPLLAPGALPDFVCNIKLPLLKAAELTSLSCEPAVAYIQQIHNKAAKQEREKGYCELVLRAGTLPDLMTSLDDIALRYQSCMEADFVAKAHALYERLTAGPQSATIGA